MPPQQACRQFSMFATLALLQLAGASCAAPASAHAEAAIEADLFVDDDYSGKEDGSALRPFKTVQKAIDAAKNNAVIAVAAGTYAQNIRVQEKSVRLYGGFPGGTAKTYSSGKQGDFTQRDTAANSTHLKGNGKDSVVTLNEAGKTIVDGFIVSGGARSQLASPSRLGGGFYIYHGSPTISNNVIEKNHTGSTVPEDDEKFGGGIYSTGASVSILYNVIRHNISGRGAAIAADGPKLIVRGNTIVKNIGVSDHGGAVYLFSPDAEISHNLILSNEIGRALGYGWGGGVIVFNKGGNYKFSHNIFSDNFAPSVGSALFVDDGAVASLENDLFFANLPNPDGNGAVPAIYVDGNAEDTGSTLHVNQTTIVDHVFDSTGKGTAITATSQSRITIKNSILWNNGEDDVEVDETSKMMVTYTLSHEKLKGTGNLHEDPLFVNSEIRDYHLRSTVGRWNPGKAGRPGSWVSDSEQSPAIDAGEPAAPFKLEPSPNGGRANLGADGNTKYASKSAD